jgi:hypothetical protein
MTITAELYNEGKNPEEPVEPTSEEEDDGTTDNNSGDGGDSEGD